MANSQNIPLPIKGINSGMAVTIAPSEYSSDMNNIRPIDTQEERLRLGKRPGLKFWGNGTQIGGVSQPVVAIAAIYRIN